LREHDRDLAQKVADGEIKLEKARDELQKRHREQHKQRDEVLRALSSVLNDAADLENSRALLELPAQLATDEGNDDFRIYFPGGVKQIWERVAAARKVLAVVDRVCLEIKNNRPSLSC
jgi:hypothetical protein